MNVNDGELVAIHRKLARKENISSSDLIEFLATNNTLTKKFICDFLVDRSHTDSNISLITANMLIRDCVDANPSIRSTSLLALSSLSDMEEAAVNYIQKSMKDQSAQVRRASVLSCLELYRHLDNCQYNTSLVDLLYEGIRDSDPIVVTNCLQALECSLEDEGGIAMNKTMLYYLLSRLENFSDSGIVQVLNIFTKYVPKNESETLYILNHLDTYFKSDSLAILLTAIKLFFHITAQYKNSINDMIIAIRYSVVNILSKNEFEYSAILLDFLLGLKTPLATVFSASYKSFMLKFSDSNIIKRKKLKLLPLIAEASTVLDIITDLKHYAKDSKNYTAIYECLGLLGIINKSARNMVMQASISTLNHSNYNIVACSLECVLKLSFIDSNQLHKEITKRINEALLRQELVENHVELTLHVLESCCTILSDAQQHFELLFSLMDTFEPSTRCRLLDVTTKCFFKLPLTIHPIIVPMMAKCFNSLHFSENCCAAFNYALIEKEANV